MIACTAPSTSGAAASHDDLGQREVLADDLQQLDAAEPRLPHVGDQDVDFLALHQRQPGLGRRRADHPEIAPQGLRQPLARLILRVDDENGLAAGRHGGEFKV